MSERPPSAAGGSDLPRHLLDTDAPVALTRTSSGVVATVTGRCGTALLTVTLRATPPEAPSDDDDTAATLVAAGVVDMYTAPLLDAALKDAVDRHTTVRCDLSDVRILAAAGITALLSAYERAAETGSRLTVHGAQGLTRRVLQITNVEHLLCEPQTAGRPAGVDQRSSGQRARSMDDHPAAPAGRTGSAAAEPTRRNTQRAGGHP